ncbi:MAG: hypothetical protein JW934_24755 [Anaerolineae bacterium]|nr:hypothetical protein [Anaerolineae bacterium]
MADSKNRKLESLVSLLEAYDRMMREVSSEEFAASNIFAVWMQQVASTLLITDMEFERRIWEEVRKIKVSLHERPAFDAYGLGMRAMLVGMIHNIEKETNQ